MNFVHLKMAKTANSFLELAPKASPHSWRVMTRDILRGSPKILAERVVLWDSDNQCFIAFLRKNFGKVKVCVVLWDSSFLEKFAKHLMHFRFISQKINVLCFKMVSNWKIFKNNNAKWNNATLAFLHGSRISKKIMQPGIFLEFAEFPGNNAAKNFPISRRIF